MNSPQEVQQQPKGPHAAPPSQSPQSNPATQNGGTPEKALTPQNPTMSLISFFRRVFLAIAGPALIGFAISLGLAVWLEHRYDSYRNDEGGWGSIVLYVASALFLTTFFNTVLAWVFLKITQKEFSANAGHAVGRKRWLFVSLFLTNGITWAFALFAIGLMAVKLAVGVTFLVIFVVLGLLVSILLCVRMLKTAGIASANKEQA